MEENDDEIEKNDLINPLNNKEVPIIQSEKTENKEQSSYYFPSAYTILIVLQFIIFILTYIIPKGKYDTIEYDSNKGKFIVTFYYTNSTPYPKEFNASQETLAYFNITINLDNFVSGLIKKPISIPNSYTKLTEEENSNFFDLFTYPLYGMLDSSDIAFLLMMIGGCINLLIEMKAFTSLMEALSRLTKGHELILLIAVVIIISISGSTFGFCEEILPFYPVLMPIFIKSGLDGSLATASLFVAEQIGNMFSTSNPFAAGIGSYSAGISFIEGIFLRVIGFIIVNLLTIGFFIFYDRRVRKDPTKSAVYDIREELRDKYINEKKDTKEEESSIINEVDIELNGIKEEKNNFTIIQKISLILFGGSFILLIVGVSALNWWFLQIATIFLFLGIILIFLIGKGEVKGIEIFTQGAGSFAGVIIIIGLARGINITLNKGLIADTILDSLSNLVDGLPKVIFAIIMLLVFIILGFFIQSSTGLAALSMPVFAPLADKVNCSRTVVVNAFMFGQGYIGLLAPTGLALIVLQLVGLKYSHWIKFIWMLMVVLLVYLIIIMIISALIE